MLERIAAFAGNGRGRLGKRCIGSITEDDIDAFLQKLRALGRAASTRNQYLQLFKGLSAWGLRKGYLSRPWFGPLSDLKREKLARRRPRLDAEEEARLLAVAPARLCRLIIAALETGCRQGELLGLQRVDVNHERREIRVRAANAKDDEDRYIPITGRLQAVLTMTTHDPAGRPFGPEAYVFGDELGQAIKSPKRAWQTAVLKAHGHRPEWVKGKQRLAPVSQHAYAEIDLHFHDLRHEAGSRWLEGGMPLHHVKELLGHADISTTDIYLSAGRIHLQDSMRRVEAAGQSCTKVAQPLPVDPPLPCNSDPDPADKSLLH